MNNWSFEREWRTDGASRRKGIGLEQLETDWKKDWISTCYWNILVPLCFLSLLKAILLVQLVRSNSVLFVLLTNIDLHNSTSNIFHARLGGIRPSAAESVLVWFVFFTTMPLSMHGGILLNRSSEKFYLLILLNELEATKFSVYNFR